MSLSLDYGTYWKENMSEEKWHNFYYNKDGMHLHFHVWYETHKADSVLEVGCGYGEQARVTFQDQNYTGIDLSSNGIDLAKSKNGEANHNFVCGNVMKENTPLSTYDLVFSINVIDHVPDPNAFIARLIELANKQVVIYAYHGFDEESENHIITVNGTNDCYLNTLSVKELKRNFDCSIKEFDCGEGKSTIIYVDRVK